MPSIDLNIIGVAFNPVAKAYKPEMKATVDEVGKIFGTVGLTLNTVTFYRIRAKDAGARAVISNFAEAVDLTQEWSGIATSGINVFVVRQHVIGTYGTSPEPKQCTGDDKEQLGAVVELNPELTGTITAHEIGHYLGLSHLPDEPDNLMHPTVPNGRKLTTDQFEKMARHCAVTSPALEP
ncbi:matrixin family metalloprotease [Herbidospora sp. RD11066]